MQNLDIKNPAGVYLFGRKLFWRVFAMRNAKATPLTPYSNFNKS